ncbi:MAG: DAK2 domain-containing protein [Ruminococcaceae bacterium]|nr:DAK2 domain-containing protein [Oscillospiraceae bacterium]
MKQSKTTKKKNSKSLASALITTGSSLLGGFLLAKMAIGGAKQLRSHADEVNKLNVFPVPDGDTGDNMRMTIESGVSAIENLNTNDLGKVMDTLSHGMLLGARGNSGVILSQFFAGTAKGFKDVEEATPEALGRALEMGVEQAYSSVMTPTEGTILTVAREAVEFAVERITPESTIRTFFADLAKEMHDSLERTPERLQALKDAGVVDSGGAGLFYIIDGFNRVLNGEEVADTSSYAEVSAKKTDVTASGFNADSVMTYGYCTELLVQLQNSKCDVANFDVEPLKEFLASVGDSIVAFKVDTIIKLHVHTLTPEKVLEHCRTFGEFLTVKIENMSVQHTETAETEAPAEKAPKKKYGVVAVTNGPGLEALFKEFGTDEIVEGGQTQNPSTNDFLDAFAKVNAEHIFALPNNSNILLAAQQAAELYKGAKIHVIPSKNIGTGYVALSSMNFDAKNPDDIISEVEEAMSRVTAGYVSPAIRDADMNGVHVTNGDTIGIVNKEIVVSHPDRLTAAAALAEKLLDGKFMLTVFTGKDADAKEQEDLQAEIAKMNPDAEVYFIDGGQEIYPYIFVAE